MRSPYVLVLVAALAQTGTGATPDVSIGSSPPALAVVKWFKGKPITAFENHKTYVVEFWATWCAPCKESIPHLTDLAKKNPDVTFIGVSIWEDDNGTKISDFVNQMGSKMDYRVGYSSNRGGMAKTWMAAAGQHGIPTAFVVKDRKVEWIGHPMELEKPLTEIKAGTFDVAAYKLKFDKQQTEAREEAAARKAIQDSEKLYKSGNKVRARTDLDAVLAKHPSVAPEIELVKLGWLAIDDPSGWELKTKALAESKNETEFMSLDMFAVEQAANPGGDRALGERAMNTLLSGPQSKNVLILYDAATVFTANKNYKKALEVTNSFLVEIKTSMYKDNADLIKSMERQRSDLEAKLKG